MIMLKNDDIKYTPLTVENILARIDQREAFIKYLNRDPKKVKPTTNPLRVDENPGCMFYYDNQDKIIFCDFSYSKYYDIFKVVMDRFNLNFYEALQKINRDFNLHLNSHRAIPPKYEVKTKEERRTRKYQIIQKDFSEKELEWWNKFGIHVETLKHFNVFSVDRFYVDKTIRAVSTEKDFIFAYYFPQSDNLKIYRPLNKNKNKWLFNGSQRDIQGMDQLPFTGDTVIITSSLKDVMLFYELGYSAIAPQGEFDSLPEEVVEYLGDYFTNQIIWYDNDTPGIKAAKKLANKTEFKWVCNEEGYPKDITDYYAEFGEKATKDMIKEILDAISEEEEM
jgi:hypothetical protein